MFTRSKLEAAKIWELENGKHKGTPINCMFNPFEYTIKKDNTFEEKPKNGANVPQADFKNSGAPSLVLDLVFDTYETQEDVSKYTDALWKLMEVKPRKDGNRTKYRPPEVEFEWGVFSFVSLITNMTQKFTMFKFNGTPVRAKVNVTFKQYIYPKDFPPTNPTSGGGDIEQVWQVVAGDRLDGIAYKVYGEATRWREIAELNKIRNPLSLIPGQRLIIPVLGD